MCQHNREVLRRPFHVAQGRVHACRRELRVPAVWTLLLSLASHVAVQDRMRA
jgi:hypothetical protein